MKRVETPEGGLPGSKGALALQTLYSGIPGQLSHKFQQDDLIANVSQKLGYMLPANWTPSYVVRVYVPPFETWEQRVGSSFGFRADCQTIINKPTKVGKLFKTGGTSREVEQYWPGFFIQFNGKNHPQHTTENTATILIRSGERGEDIPGPVITRPGWWTLGMTITSDGKVHYYGHEGVANLTSKDHLYSNYPYGYKCLNTSTFFFNVVNQDDGKTWSTRWIVDDPKVYVATRPYTAPVQKTAQVPAQPISQVKPQEPVQPPMPPAQTPLAAPSQAPTAQPAVPAVTPAAPAAPAAPALQAAPAPVTPAPTAPATLAPPAAPAAAPATPKAAEPNASASLPPLSGTPLPVTPAKGVPAPAAAPALLPDETEAKPMPAVAPVIAAPAPAPLAPPAEEEPALEDAPTLPPEAPSPSLPPAPAMPK